MNGTDCKPIIKECKPIIEMLLERKQLLVLRTIVLFVIPYVYILSRTYSVHNIRYSDETPNLEVSF